MQGNDFRHRPAQHGQRRDAIASRYVRTGRSAAHHARDFRPRRVGQLGLVLVEAPRLQSVGERHTRGVHVDEGLAVACGWLVDLDDLCGPRAVEPGYLNRAHPAI